ncbi:MAG: peroxidase family protein [Fuerstiella sp.]
MKNHKCPRPSSVIESLEPLVLMSASPTADGAADDATEGEVQISWDYGERLDGSNGSDTLIALVGDNVLHGEDGNDELTSVRGDNFLDGGAGHDTAVYWALRQEFTFVRRDDGVIIVSNGQRTDQLSGIEYVRFDDGTFVISDLIGDPADQYRSIDGTGNNQADPELGSTNEALLRLTSPEYTDGISAPAGADRPSARLISNELVAQQTVALNDRELTDLTWLWGQFLDHDIDLTEGAEPHEPYYVPVPEGDPWFDPDYTGEAEIELNRSVYDPTTGDGTDNPRQQINQITAFIDGSNVYGFDDVRAAALRSFENGLLRVSDGDLLPFNDAGLPNAGGTGTNLFLAGDVRANENAALSSMHTLWVREHNRIATELAAATPGLSDEQLYQQARELVIAEIQAITYREFLPALLGDSALPDYLGYDPDTDPSIATEFSTAAYRVGHTLLSSELLRLNNDGSVIEAGHLDLQSAFFAPQHVVEHGIDSLLLGVTQQAASEVDTMIVDDVRNFLFGPPGAGGFDLASLNLQRGRDHGLADYNQVRTELGLQPVTSFSDITSDPDLQQRLADVYGSVDDMDLWVAGLAEDHVAGSSLGETFRTILIDQFTRLRDGDRFWYQQVLEAEQLQLVESTSLADVIERNTGVQGLQDNVFFLS